MPVIPQFETQGTAQIGLRTPELDSSIVGAPAGAAAAGFSQIEGVTGAFAQRYFEAKRASQAADLVAGSYGKLAELEHKWSLVPDRQQAINGFNGEAAGLKKQTLDGIADPLVKAHVQQMFDERAITGSIQAGQAAFGLESSTRQATLADHVNGYAQQLANAKSDVERAQIVDAVKGEIGATVQGGWISPLAGEQHFLAFRSRASLVSAEQERNAVEASQDPKLARAFAAKVNDPKAFPDLDPQQRETLGYRAELLADRIQMRADRAADEAAARTRIVLGRQYENAVAMVERGIAPPDLPSERAIAAAFPRNPEAAADFAEKVRDLKAIGGALSILPDATPEQVAKLRAGAAPDPANPSTFARRATISAHLDRALALRDKALGDDPAGYIMTTHPELGQGFSDALKDPAKLSDYADRTLGLQAQMGLPQEARHILPVSASQSMARDIIAEPEKAPAKLKDLEQHFGALWPQAWRDLTTVQGGLPPAFQAVGAIDDEGQTALLARGLAEQGKSGKTLSDLLPPKAKAGAAGIDTTIEGAGEVRQLLSSLSSSGASAGMQRDVLGAIRTLAYANVVYGGKDPPAATEAAIGAFTGKFEFMPNGGARVPRDKFAAVSANAATLLRGLDESGVAVPDIYGKPGMPKPSEFVDMLRASPHWITAPGADALWLLDAYGRLARDKAGKPLAVPFSSPAPPADAPNFATGMPQP